MSVIFNIIVLYPNLILAFLHPKPFGNLSLWFKFDGDLYWTSLPVVKDLSRLFPYLKTSQRNSSSRSRLSLVDKSVLQHCQQEVKYSRLRAQSLSTPRSTKETSDHIRSSIMSRILKAQRLKSCHSILQQNQSITQTSKNSTDQVILQCCPELLQ